MSQIKSTINWSQRRYFADKSSSTQSYDFSRSHVWMWVWKVLKVQVAQSCPTLWNPMDYTVHGILQAKILEWVAFPFSRETSQPRDRTQVSHIAGGFFTSWAWTKSRALKNWCFWTVTLEKTLESPLDCKEIQPVHPKGNQPWVFVGRTDAESLIL